MGLRRTSYHAILDQIDRRLARSAPLRDFRTAVPRLRDWFAALPDDPVIALGDIQMHNMAVDRGTGALLGVFDFDGAAVADRLEDFKYLPSFGVAFTRVTLEAYSAAAGGPPLGLDGVGRFHVLSALVAQAVKPAEPRFISAFLRVASLAEQDCAPAGSGATALCRPVPPLILQA